ncbi:MAG: MerR family transcriptional regulator [Chloroflexota bacterium]|nr:MerR family transcriptional regulator [Chloroflexota bacterium]
MSEYLRTVDLARAVGLGVQQVRNYEAWGFLPPAERSPSRYRRYTPRHLEALKTARVLIRGYGWQRALEVMRTLHSDNLDAALALVDARHAELDRDRRRVEQTLAALRPVASESVEYTRVRSPRGLRVGEAARRVGVEVSAVRYWEQRGLLTPLRDESSRYRLYDEREMLRLQVIVLLREAGYGVEAIAPVLDELGSGRPEKALESVEMRRADIARASRECAEATAILWEYVSQGQNTR